MGKAINRRNYDQAIVDLVEMVKILREDNRQLQVELKDRRRLDNEMISVLGDLRGELEHLRTQRYRDERFTALAKTVRPRKQPNTRRK